MEGKYKLIFAGELQPGIDKDEAAAALGKRFGVSANKARALVYSDREVTVKKDLDREKAVRYRTVLEEIGLLVRLEPELILSEHTGLSLEPIGGETPPKEVDIAGADDKPLCPKCGSDRIEGDACLECGIIISKYLAIQARSEAQTTHARSETASHPDNDSRRENPYAAPQAQLVAAAEEGELNGPISVPVGHGWHWLARGFWHFKRNPFSWIFALILWGVSTAAIAIIPLLGGLLVNLFAPVILAGFVIGAHSQHQGGNFQVRYLVAGFSRNAGHLVLVGVLYLIGMVVVLGVAGGMMLGTFSALGGMETMQTQDPAMAATLLQNPSFALAGLVGLGLMIPLLMAYWFAPALVAVDGLSALSAMQLSFVGCLKNILPFLLYGVISFVLLIIGSLPFGLGLLIVLPVFMASIYVAYRDIYYA